MKLSEQITEESHRFYAFYRQKPDCVYLGTQQAEQFDAMIKAITIFGFTVSSPQPTPTFMGMRIYRVDQPSYLGFGLDLPSPCG